MGEWMARWMVNNWKWAMVNGTTNDDMKNSLNASGHKKGQPQWVRSFVLDCNCKWPKCAIDGSTAAVGRNLKFHENSISNWAQELSKLSWWLKLAKCGCCQQCGKYLAHFLHSSSGIGLVNKLVKCSWWQCCWSSGCQTAGAPLACDNRIFTAFSTHFGDHERQLQ